MGISFSSAIRLLIPALFLLAAVSVPARAVAADVEVDLELALAVDVSGSIDQEEAILQRDGYVAAFKHPRIVEAIRYGYLGRIAVAYFEWAGYGHVRVIADWTLVHDKASADAFAEMLSITPPETAHRTAISQAIDFAVPFFDGNGFNAKRRVIDISGDGPNNWGRLVTQARDAAVAQGITINGLPIVNNRPSPWGWRPIPNLDLYYRDCVIGGRGAFIVVANEFKDFAAAVRRKLVLEIAGLAPADPALRARTVRSPTGIVPVANGRVAPPCDIGERRMRDAEDF